MLVSNKDFETTLSKIREAKAISLDTETTGLYPFKNARLFSIIISTGVEEFYFNYTPYPGLALENILDRRHKKALHENLTNLTQIIYMHNAKFDMHMLSNEGIECKGIVHCTQAIARLIDNELLSYSLDNLGKKYFNHPKDDKVKDFIKKHNLYSISQKGKDTVKNPQYYKVPIEIIVPYGETDAKITHKLGEYQRKYIDDSDRNNASSKLLGNVYQNELKLTKTLYYMEKKGIKLDEEYCREALKKETDKYKKAEKEFQTLTGTEFVDSRKTFVPAFDKLSLIYGKTEKGNASFTDDILSKIDNPLTKIIKAYRESYKVANSYYRNFLYFQDANGIIHTNFRQSGTKTGRLSASHPALQTLPKGVEGIQTKDAAKVRRCFIPRNDEYVFFMPDYDQMEYRFMLNYAKELEVIREVNSGLDVHTATAKTLGVSRIEAKTINFLLLYGGGDQKLATALKCRLWDAKQKKRNYFMKLPNVKKFIRGVIKTAETRKYLINWLGRVYKFPDPAFAYKGPNFLIQGGTADLVKIALVTCFELLAGSKSSILLQVHDELVFELHKSELHFAREIVKIMENVFVTDLLKLTCSPEYSHVSLADKTKGYPDVKSKNER